MLELGRSEAVDGVERSDLKPLTYLWCADLTSDAESFCVTALATEDRRAVRTGASMK
jgi:hypothetical protein